MPLQRRLSSPQTAGAHRLGEPAAGLSRHVCARLLHARGVIVTVAQDGGLLFSSPEHSLEGAAVCSAFLTYALFSRSLRFAPPLLWCSSVMASCLVPAFSAQVRKVPGLLLAAQLLLLCDTDDTTGHTCPGSSSFFLLRVHKGHIVEVCRDSFRLTWSYSCNLCILPAGVFSTDVGKLQGHYLWAASFRSVFTLFIVY